MAPRHWMMMAVVFAAGCGGKVTSGDDSTDANGDLTASPNGNACEAPATSDASYPYCRWNGAMGYESFCEKTYDGWGYLNWHTDADGSSYCSNDASCNTCSCFISCSAKADEPVDCPQPETGTAHPECLGNGTCMLTCDNGEECPTGMHCVQTNEFGRQVCAWVCNP